MKDSSQNTPSTSPNQSTDKNSSPARLPSHLILDTASHKAGCEVTTRVWAKHKSELLEDSSYQATISRVPIGQCHLCFVDCLSPMRVVAEGSATKAVLYLPKSGSMDINVQNKQFFAVPGGPVFIPAKEPIEFHATAIQCIVLEIPVRKLNAELTVWGQMDPTIPPFQLAPDSSDALSLSELLSFAVTDIERLGETAPPALHLNRLEAHIIAILVRAIINQAPSKSSQKPHIGRLSMEEIDVWMRAHLENKSTISELAAHAGITQRALQKAFFRYFHTTPLAYIRNLRFEAAHRSLLDSACHKSITEIAMQFQFLHLGRFASDYHKKFGEAPSQTLQKRQ